MCTDRRADGADCVTFPAYAVGKNVGRYRDIWSVLYRHRTEIEIPTPKHHYCSDQHLSVVIDRSVGERVSRVDHARPITIPASIAHMPNLPRHVSDRLLLAVFSLFRLTTTVDLSACFENFSYACTPESFDDYRTCLNTV